MIIICFISLTRRKATPDKYNNATIRAQGIEVPDDRVVVWVISGEFISGFAGMGWDDCEEEGFAVIGECPALSACDPS